jgi:hypothetical protein
MLNAFLRRISRWRKNRFIDASPPMTGTGIDEAHSDLSRSALHFSK